MLRSVRVARAQTLSIFTMTGALCRRYALEWNVDFLKNDCVFGAQFVLDEVTAQSHILESLAATHGVDLVYSLSPGGHDTVPEIVAKGRQVSSLVSMYRCASLALAPLPLIYPYKSVKSLCGAA
eukprot:COSAG03_NODE_623_length_6665_cov_3.515230_3_plen_124_part_00